MPTGALVAENPLHSAAFLSIPPNTVARHERYWPLPKPALIISFQPHMHFRGTRMMLEAIHPDGRREVLTDANRYEQNWQITYTYKTPHLFPAGTILHTISYHDNTAANKHNPDPTAWIGWGSRTMDEMGHGWTDIAFLTDEQYQEELAARRAKKQQTTAATAVARTFRQRSADLQVRLRPSAFDVARRTPERRRSSRTTNDGDRSVRDRDALSGRLRSIRRRRTASGGRGPAISAPRATHRSIRSTPPTSARSRSPGGSRPTTSARVPTSTCRPAR